MKRPFGWLLALGLMILVLTAGTSLAQLADNVIGNGDLESRGPFFWDYGDTGGDASFEWTQEQAHNGTHSLKIVKTTTGEAASLITGNQANTYWNAAADVLYDLGGWVMVESGASASATTEGERIGLRFTFKDAGGSDIVAPVFLAADPSDNAWQQVTGQVLLTAVPETITCEVIIEASATGTAYFDEFSFGSDPWTAGFFGDDVETPAGWMHWADGTQGYANADTSSMAHSGDYVAKLIENDSNDDEMVFYSIPYPASPSTDYIVGAWAKSIGVNYDESFYPSAIMSGEGSYINDRANVCFFFHAGDIDHSWSLTGGDQFFYLDQRAADVDWEGYGGIVTSPEDATGISMRARYNNFNTGTTLYDDFFALKVSAGDNLVVNGDLETVTPFFWSAGQTGGTLTWADDDAHNGTHSLKIEKTSTGTAASWMTGNQANTYWNAASDVLYDLGGWVNIASGASASATTDGERIGLLFTFKDDGGADIVAPTFLAADPAVSDWQQVTGQVLLTAVPATITCEAIIEANATGTAWFDEFSFGSDPWTAGFFGDDVETPAGWMHWADGTQGYANLVDVGSEAHSGTHVAKLLEEDANDDEMVFYSIPNSVEPETWYEFSVWVRTDNVSPIGDSLIASGVLSGDGAYLNNRANICFFFHSGDIDHSWSLTGGDQFIYFAAQTDSTGWTQYRGVSMSPNDATGASVRARFNNFNQGEVWYDDFEIRKLTVQEVLTMPEQPGDRYSALPDGAVLQQNYPNPFNASTLISYSLPKTSHVSIELFDLLGRQIATLYEGVQTAGSHSISLNLAEHDMHLSSGIYFYRLSTPESQMTRKMVYMK